MTTYPSCKLTCKVLAKSKPHIVCGSSKCPIIINRCPKCHTPRHSNEAGDKYCPKCMSLETTIEIPLQGAVRQVDIKGSIDV